MGDCGEMWGILVCGIVAVGRGVGGRETFPIVGWGQLGVCGLRDVQIFTNFDIFKNFFNFNIFYDIFFLLKIVNLTNYHKKWHFPYTLQNFPMCVGNTLLQNPTVFLTDC